MSIIEDMEETVLTPEDKKICNDISSSWTSLNMYLKTNSDIPKQDLVKLIKAMTIRGCKIDLIYRVYTRYNKIIKQDSFSELMGVKLKTEIKTGINL